MKKLLLIVSPPGYGDTYRAKKDSQELLIYFELAKSMQPEILEPRKCGRSINGSRSLYRAEKEYLIKNIE